MHTLRTANVIIYDTILREEVEVNAWISAQISATVKSVEIFSP